MSVGNRFVVAVVFSGLGLLAGCGGGSGVSRPTPPPSGGFTNSSLNGSYTFSVGGSDSLGIFGMAGTFVACGCSQGTISSGTVDIINPSGTSSSASLTNKSTYQMTSDGRGLAKLFIAASGSVAVSEIDLDFVLTSSSHGLVIRYDQNGTGSGAIDLQSGTLTQTDLTTTPYAFSISGGDLSNLPLSLVGALTVDASGTITTGVEDLNHNGAVTSNLALSGSLTVGSGTSPGQAILTTSSGTLRFSVYAIDANHLKLIENDGQNVLSGDAFSQPSALFPVGTLVFTMTGLDSSGFLFATVGAMSSDGNSLITNGVEDINDGGSVDNNTNPAQPFAFTGTFAGTGGGRFQVTLSNYVGGSLFAAYPSSAGVLMLEMDPTSGGVTGGIAALQQSGATLNASQGYGLNLSGQDLTSGLEIDLLAEFKTTSTQLTGIADQNAAGSIQTANVNGSYNVANGFGTATFSSGLPSLFFYPVDSASAFFITADPTVTAVGSLQMQSAPSSAAAQTAAKHTSLVPVQRVLPHRARSAHAK